MSVKRIKVDTLLDAISKAAPAHVLPKSDKGATIHELRAHWGCSIQAARKRVNAALELGAVVRGRKYTVDAASRVVSVPVYRPKP